MIVAELLLKCLLHYTLIGSKDVYLSVNVLYFPFFLLDFVILLFPECNALCYF